MAIDSKHPQYAEHADDWQVMDDTYHGQRVVKAAGQHYLPPTSGMVQDGMLPGQAGWMAYQAYLKRAIFHDFVADAVEAMIGMMHHKPPVIEVPAAMEPMVEKATLNGEGLEILLRRINEAQLVTGRLGLLLDLPSTPSQDGTLLPYIALYNAVDILNWDNGRREMPVLQNLNLVVLNESEYERQPIDFSWEFTKKYRVLVLGAVDTNEPAGQGTYQVGLFREDVEFDPTKLIAPSLRGRTLDRIPFVFINSKDIVPDPDDPPLLGLANLALSIYRGEADYRQSLFMQGQDTLVVIGAAGEENYRIGANAVLNVPMGGDAKYIGVSSDGLKEQREALQNDKTDARSRGSQMIDNRSKDAESGDALRIRVAARTATLNQIALAGAFGLEQVLRMAATWIGANPDDVKVTPNLDFAADEFDSKTLVDYMSAKALGAPLSLQSIHEKLKEKDVTNLDFEEEMRLIQEEEALMPAPEPAPGDQPPPDAQGSGNNPEQQPPGSNGGTQP